MRIVLLPGMDGTGELFGPLLEQLSPDLNIEIVRYPSERKLDYVQLESFVAECLPEDGEYLLIAESFSGILAYNLALKKVRKITGIIFVASFLRSPSRLASYARFVPMSLVLRLPLPMFVIRRFLLGKDTAEAMVLRLRETLRRVPANVLAYRLRQVAGMVPADEPLDVPCVYITASDDRLVPPDNLDLFRRLIPNLRVVSVQGPHFVLQANPGECARIIEQEYRLVSDPA